jgi:hypothetical protein
LNWHSSLAAPEDTGHVFHWYAEGQDIDATGAGDNKASTTTSSSPIVTGIAGGTAVMVAGGTNVTGTGIPAGTRVSIVGRLLTARIANGSAIITGISSTTGITGGGCGVGDVVYSYNINYAIPPGACVQSVDSGTRITLTVAAVANSTNIVVDNGTTVTELAAEICTGR